MSHKPAPPPEHGSQAQALLRAARGDHDPTALERAAVRRALAQRFVHGPDGFTGKDGALGHGVPQLKVWLIGGCVSLAALGAIGAFVAMRRAAVEEHRQVSAQPAQQAVVVSHAPVRPQPTISAEPASPVAAQDLRGSQTRSQTSARLARRDRIRSVTSTAPALRDGASVTSTAPAARIDSPAVDDGLQAAQEAPSPPVSAAPAAHDVDVSIATETTVSKQLDARDAALPRVAELAWMQRIHAALREGNPRLALALCTEHQQRWPHGLFQQEREGARAIAACQLHLTRDQESARDFLARYPRSTLVSRVRAACGLLSTEASTSDPTTRSGTTSGRVKPQ